jgi:hypothetical protein
MPIVVTTTGPTRLLIEQRAHLHRGLLIVAFSSSYYWRPESRLRNMYTPTPIKISGQNLPS